MQSFKNTYFKLKTEVRSPLVKNGDRTSTKTLYPSLYLFAGFALD
ncbi:MAG: hypothetical protein RM021_003935 [Nostoc sp. EkiNYC01]|nr:hypothetical protein [Nostoc sp. EkiNYC01]